MTVFEVGNSNQLIFTTLSLHAVGGLGGMDYGDHNFLTFFTSSLQFAT